MKAVICLRTATIGQDDEQKMRLHRDLAEQYCAQHGITVYDFFVDEGVSGLTAFAQRPAGARLLVDAAAGAFELVLVQRMDRLGRDTRIVQSVQAELRSHGVTVRSLT